LKIKDNIIIAKKHFFEKFVQYLMSVFQTWRWVHRGEEAYSVF
jgi:hypothetical protein